MTGAGPARITQYDSIQDALPIVGAATAALIALVGLNFLSPPPARAVRGGLAYLLVDIRRWGWISENTGISIPSEIEPLLVVLLLGISTDYAIFYLSGQSFGDRRARSRCPRRARSPPSHRPSWSPGAPRQWSSPRRRLDFMRAFGPGHALSALIGVVVSVTFVPAAIALLGARPLLAEPGAAPPARAGEPRRSLRERAAFWSTARPLALLIVLLCVAGLGAAASGLGQ